MLLGIILCIRCCTVRNYFFRRKEKVESFVSGTIDIAIVSCTSAQAAEDMGRGCGDGCRPNIEPLCELTGL